MSLGREEKSLAVPWVQVLTPLRETCARSVYTMTCSMGVSARPMENNEKKHHRYLPLMTQFLGRWILYENSITSVFCAAMVRSHLRIPSLFGVSSFVRSSTCTSSCSKGGFDQRFECLFLCLYSFRLQYEPCIR